MFIINYYQAGTSQKGSSFSTNVAYFYFRDKINFNLIRTTAKELLEAVIKDECPCINDIRIYFHIMEIEDNEVVRSTIGDFKSLNILKWHDPRKK